MASLSQQTTWQSEGRTTMATSSLSGKADPVVRKISREDVVDALDKGLRDFKAAPRYGLFLGGLCAATGISIVIVLFEVGMPYFAYPIAAGFALVCPFLAAGLYEVSRRLEAGEPLSAGAIWHKLASRSEVRWMGFATLFVFIVWMYQVRLLMALFLGYSGMAASLPEFFRIVLTTPEGLIFLLVGNVIGAVLATILFSLSVVSCPLVLDRDVDFVTAMVTSVRAVLTNPGPMLLFAVTIIGFLLISVFTAFLGLLLTLPLLGHATWHLYRSAVAPAVEGE
jgi:uncharacterized membrane protein